MKELKPKAKELCATQLALGTHKTPIHSDIEMSIVRYESVSANRSYDLQKKPFPDVLQNRCSERFCNIHRKTPVLGSLFIKVTGLLWCLKWF